MNRWFTYIFTVFLAALVFYGGPGVNLVSYCCNACRSAGTEVLLGEKCCEIHKHNHEGETVESANENTFSHSHEACCDLKRLSFDWDSGSVSIHIVPVVLHLFLDNIPNISSEPLPKIKEIFSFMQTGPPILTPRVYLSLLTTLLI